MRRLRLELSSRADVCQYWAFATSLCNLFSYFGSPSTSLADDVMLQSRSPLSSLCSLPHHCPIHAIAIYSGPTALGMDSCDPLTTSPSLYTYIRTDMISWRDCYRYYIIAKVLTWRDPGCEGD